MIFGVLISTISFWTLWQTRRIEQNQGAEVSGFAQLIDRMAAEIEVLVKDLRDHGYRPRAHHRFLLVTTNPFFGRVSFKSAECTTRYTDALRHLATAASEVLQKSGGNAGHRLDVRILCGTRKALEDFHSIYFPPQTGQAISTEAANASDDAESLLAQLLHESGAAGLLIERRDTIPRTQFAIVGNAVFEFVLTSPGSQTEVHTTRLLREAVVCQRFIETFEILLKLP
ncbi:MAG: hypothetical protein JST16_04650 [Bdellovibrionales bacterium]|nr:hypothetical protein [Bdellovibrionales bacterium]